MQKGVNVAAQIKKEDYDLKVKTFKKTKAIFDQQYAVAQAKKQHQKVSLLPKNHFVDQVIDQLHNRIDYEKFFPGFGKEDALYAKRHELSQQHLINLQTELKEKQDRKS